MADFLDEPFGILHERPVGAPVPKRRLRFRNEAGRVPTGRDVDNRIRGPVHYECRNVERPQQVVVTCRTVEQRRPNSRRGTEAGTEKRLRLRALPLWRTRQGGSERAEGTDRVTRFVGHRAGDRGAHRRPDLSAELPSTDAGDRSDEHDGVYRAGSVRLQEVADHEAAV